MPEQLSARADVCAVVVTYHPDSDFPARLNGIVPQVGGTVVVDNGSCEESSSMLRKLSGGPGLTLINNLENLGVARALNIGVRHAVTHGYSWALLLDQDTEVDEDMVEKLLAAHASYPDADRVAVVGTRFRDTNERPAEPRYLDSKDDHWEEVESVITSGSLLSLNIYAAVGPFRDEFFIDYVDTEYCFRARAAGYRIIETRRPFMSHTIGAPTRHRVLGTTTWTTNHSPDRRYYIARNNTVLLREYGTTGGGSWRMKSIVRCLRLCKRIAFFEQGKVEKILAVAQGWWDGMRGKLGPRGSASQYATKPRPTSSTFLR
jgi:rhamnosyltransferase